MSEWIRVKDRLPENHEKVLISTEDGEVGVGWWLVLSYTRINFNNTSMAERHWGKVFTHWMPLPLPPPPGS